MAGYHQPLAEHIIHFSLGGIEAAKARFKKQTEI
jgi:hypothetical protein